MTIERESIIINQLRILIKTDFHRITETLTVLRCVAKDPSPCLTIQKECAPNEDPTPLSTQQCWRSIELDAASCAQDLIGCIEFSTPEPDLFF